MLFNSLFLHILLLIISYLLGSISFGLVSAKVFKLQDPRTFGSKNIGATNILRSGNKLAAIFTLIGDLLKGLLVIYCGKYLIYHGIVNNQSMLAYMGFSVFIGHLFPIWLHFKGGKGVATAAGVLLGLNWIIGILTIITWLLIGLIFKYSSLAAIIASFIASFLSLYFYSFSVTSYIIICMSCLLLFKHKKNILNLIYKKESKIGQKS